MMSLPGGIYNKAWPFALRICETCLLDKGNAVYSPPAVLERRTWLLRYYGEDLINRVDR